MVVDAAEAGEECWEDLPEGLKDRIKILMSDVDFFARLGNGLKLRKYQQEVAHTIVRSIMNGLGLTIVVQFPRQSGKNELQALVEAYMLTLLMQDEVEIVKVCPTWKPQTLNAMRRLQRVLAGNMIAAGRWLKENGYIYRIGKARIFFLSGEPSANVVGATASTLLECDEAQDVLPSKWDKDFLPMAASTNATRVLWGTAWTSTTLLAREMRLALPDSTAWPDDALNGWIDEAIRAYSTHFPLTHEFAIQAISGQRLYEMSFDRAIMGVLQVEYPAGQEPPRYLKRLRRAHPCFVGGPVYDFYVDGFPETPVLILGETPASGQAIQVLIETPHHIPTGDASVLSVPETHIEALRLYVIWQALQQAENREAARSAGEAGADSTSLNLPMLGVSASRAERAYRAKIGLLKRAHAPGGVAGPWASNELDSIY